MSRRKPVMASLDCRLQTRFTWAEPSKARGRVQKRVSRTPRRILIVVPASRTLAALVRVIMRAWYPPPHLRIEVRFQKRGR